MAEASNDSGYLPRKVAFKGARVCQKLLATVIADFVGLFIHRGVLLAPGVSSHEWRI